MHCLDKYKSYIVLRYIFITALINMAIHQTTFAVGLMPVPEFNAFIVNAKVNFDTNTNWYSYQYSFTNPASNTGDVWHIKFDITQQGNNLWNFTGLTVPFGTRDVNFIDMYNSRKPFALPRDVGIVPIGQTAPIGWVGGFGRDGTASFAAATGTPMIGPGSTKDGFVLISPGLPIIRQVEIKPHWVVLVDSHDDLSFEEEKTASQISKDLSLITYSIGPSGFISQGSFNHWNIVRNNINKAIDLNWIKDQTFADALLGKLQDSRTSVNNQDGRSARAFLEEALQLLNDTTLEQRNQEIHDIILIHFQSLINYTYDIPPRFEPKLTAKPSVIKLPVGTLHIIKAKVINLADKNAPVSRFPLLFNVSSGPHKGLSMRGYTDINGEYEFRYAGEKVGKDNIVIIPFEPPD